jgi:hypothetical protein
MIFEFFTCLENAIKLQTPFPKENLSTLSDFILRFKITSHSSTLIAESEKAPFKVQFTRYNPLNQCWGQYKNEPHPFSGQAAFEAAMAL